MNHGNENNPLVYLMENGHSILKAQSPNSILQSEG
jgi:hypothetical protein